MDYSGRGGKVGEGLYVFGCGDYFLRYYVSLRLLYILANYIDKNIKELLMINFQEFLVLYNPTSDKEHDSSPHLSDLSSEDHRKLTLSTVNSIHEDYIQEIQECYSSIEHSENLLDRMVQKDQDYLGFNKKDDDKYEAICEEQMVRRRTERRLKNQTKNIPKNFGKGIIKFIEKNQRKFKSIFDKNNVNYPLFLVKMKEEKQYINTIADLRRLWTDPEIGKCFRIISNLFFRRYALQYIFNSRISNFSSHIKYRTSLWSALKNPDSFNHIKQY